MSHDPEGAYLAVIQMLDDVDEWELLAPDADTVWRANARHNLNNLRQVLRNLIVAEEQLAEGRMGEPRFRVMLDVNERLGITNG